MSLSDNSGAELSKPIPCEKAEKKDESQTASNQFYYYVSNDAPISKPSTLESKEDDSRSRSRDRPRKGQQAKHLRKHSREKKHRHSHSRKTDRESVELTQEEAYYRTKLCPQYKQGSCRKGSDCSFAHGEKYLRGFPNFKKTKLCIAFKEGKCGKPSGECKYAHGESELRRIGGKEYRPEKKRSRSPIKKQGNSQNLNMAYMIPGTSMNPPPTDSCPYPPPSGSMYPPSTSSYPPSSYPPSSYPPSSYPPSSYPPSCYPPSSYPPSSYPPSSYPPSSYQPSSYPVSTYVSGSYPPVGSFPSSYPPAFQRAGPSMANSLYPGPFDANYLTQYPYSSYPQVVPKSDKPFFDVNRFS